MYLERANEDYKKNGTLLTTSKVKADILEKLAETVYLYTAYPSSAQISDVAEALVEKYPCLRDPGSFSGYYDWEQSIKYKMANYRTKLRGFGVPELQDEFRRITTVHLESKFMSKLDEYTPKLLVLFHSKGEALGLRLQAILLKSEEGEADLKKPHSTKGKSRVVKSVRLHAAAPVRKLRESSLDMTLEVEMVLRILPPVPPSSPILRKLLGVHSVKPLYALSCMLMGFLCIQ
ncbi:hypothetical protein AOLI_G00242030 [Acnodon oligacanthus]